MASGYTPGTFLPVELYRKHELDLVAEPIGFVSDITSRLAFKLLRDDPDARLILHMHGAAGTVGSGYRVPNYRALSAGQPGKIHVLTFDYRVLGAAVARQLRMEFSSMHLKWSTGL